MGRIWNKYRNLGNIVILRVSTHPANEIGRLDQHPKSAFVCSRIVLKFAIVRDLNELAICTPRYLKDWYSYFKWKSIITQRFTNIVYQKKEHFWLGSVNSRNSSQTPVSGIRGEELTVLGQRYRECLEKDAGHCTFSLCSHLLLQTFSPHWEQMKKDAGTQKKSYVDTGPLPNGTLCLALKDLICKTVIKDHNRNKPSYMYRCCMKICWFSEIWFPFPPKKWLICFIIIL